MEEELYVSLYYGQNEKAIEHLQKLISIYEDPAITQKTQALKNRIEHYKSILSDLQAKIKH